MGSYCLGSGSYKPLKDPGPSPPPSPSPSPSPSPLRRGKEGTGVSPIEGEGMGDIVVFIIITLTDHSVYYVLCALHHDRENPSQCTPTGLPAALVSDRPYSRPGQFRDHLSCARPKSRSAGRHQRVLTDRDRGARGGRFYLSAHIRSRRAVPLGLRTLHRRGAHAGYL